MKQQDSEVAGSFASYLESLSPDKHLLIARYSLVDTAFKVVGVGSVGTYCGIALLMSGEGDPLFLQFKQANRSVLEPYAGASPHQHTGQRVVTGQRLMQVAGDMFLGWATGAGAQHRHFYIRHLSDAKIKPAVESMKPSNLTSYARQCGRALARTRPLRGPGGAVHLHGPEHRLRRCIGRFQRGPRRPERARPCRPGRGGASR